MEWLTLAVWIIVFAIALPLARGALAGHASLALQAMAATAGLGLMIAYVASGQPNALIWLAFAFAAVGALALLAAAISLTAERSTPAPASVLRMEETDAGLAGVQLPMFCVALALTLTVALEIGTSI
jgi:hypothetical protein